MENHEEHDGSVDPRALLERTDWDAVYHCCWDMAPPTEDILLRLFADDAAEQGHALRELREAVWRGNVVSSATAPAVSFVAAVLGDPRTLVPVTDRTPDEEREQGTRIRFPLRAGLLDWLGDVLEDAARQQGCAYGDEEDVEAVLAQAPALHDAVRPFLDDTSPDVREAALGAFLPLLSLPALTGRIPEHRDRVRRLSRSGGRHRARAVDTLAFWGEDLSTVL
ncbi:hypothetical protein LG634_06525 [Streptomyces bambusae]|uniref:hypothetical protein n=1 Tax=Streptomyces bambusae TaxID=1550616 RepID=UPI001CFD1585|nr:hypothetical protein [Streptomyces bambusae]MCB5164490.1 hypothetical protein [Streptomyces bambusae]